MADEIDLEMYNFWNFRGPVTLTLTYRHASVIDLYLHTKFHSNQRNFFLDRLTTGTPLSPRHVTQKVGQISKIRPEEFRYCAVV